MDNSNDDFWDLPVADENTYETTVLPTADEPAPEVEKKRNARTVILGSIVLALAVLVRREINLIRLFGERLYLLYDLIVIGADFVFGLEAFIFDFDAEAFFRKIADMSLGSDDVVVIA